MFPSASLRVLPAAGGISLAALLAVTGVVSAAPLPVFRYSVAADVVTASVTGDAQTGVWRVRFVSPTGDKRIDLVLRTGDIQWSSSVRVSRKLGNSWTLVSVRSLDEALATSVAATGCNAGVCWDSSQLRLPRNGDSRFGVTVRLAHTGTYRVSGGVREASEAFVFGPWIRTAGHAISH